MNGAAEPRRDSQSRSVKQGSGSGIGSSRVSVRRSEGEEVEEFERHDGMNPQAHLNRSDKSILFTARRATIPCHALAW